VASESSPMSSVPGDVLPGANPVQTVQRRLSAERTAGLYDDVLVLLREHGYDGLTMDAVAARSRVSKATLYRQWRGKPGLVVEALRERHAQLAVSDTGSLRDDLLAIARRLGCAAPTEGPLFAAVAHAAHSDPELAVELRRHLFEPLLGAIRGVLDSAVERGELAPDTPALEYCALGLMSLMPGRPLMQGRIVDQAFLTGYVESVLLPALGVRLPAA
jgi:AcrR family transcriptional regulator